MKKEVQLPVIISFRIDAEAKAALDGVAAVHGMKASAFARSVVIEAIGSAAVIPRVSRRIMYGDEFRKLLGELGRQGSNLNQLVRHTNAGGRASDLTDVVKQLCVEHATALRAATRFIVGADQ